VVWNPDDNVGMGGQLPQGDPQDESFLSSIAHTALSPLVYLGESLSKPGYAVRGLLAGQGPSSLLNLIPFSDAMGITDPAEHVTGRDLARKMGWADQEDTWGNFFGGIGLDIATDPLSALSFGGKALTQGGLDALKEGTLATTRAARIAKGQSGLLGLHTPWFTDMLGLPKAQTAIGTGDSAQFLAGLMDKAGTAVASTKPGAYLRSMFDPLAGHTTDPRVQQGVAEVGRAPAEAFNAKFRQQLLPYIDMQQQADALMKGAGMSAEDSANMWGKLTNIAGEGTPVPADLMQGYKGVDSVAIPNLHDQISDLADQAGKGVAGLVSSARQEAIDHGVVVPELQDLFRGYLPQRGIAFGNTMKSQQQARTLIPPLGGGANEMNDIAATEKVMLPNGQSVPLAGLKSSEAGWDKNLYDNLIAQKTQDFVQRDLQKQKELLNAGGLAPEQENFLRNLTEEKITANAKDRASYFAELSPDVVQAGRGIYDPDLLGRATNYINNLAQQVKTSEGITNTLAREALPMDAAKAANIDRGSYMTAGEALDRLKVNAKDVVDQGGVDVYSSGGRASLFNKLSQLGKVPATGEAGVGQTVYHSGPEIKGALKPYPGNLGHEPTGIYFAETPEEALASTTHVKGIQSTVSPYQVNAKNILDATTPEGMAIRNQLLRSAQDEAISIAEAKGLQPANTKFNTSYRDRMLQAIDEQTRPLEQTLNRASPALRNNLLSASPVEKIPGIVSHQDLLTQKLLNSGYDAMKTVGQGGTGADWLVALDPAIVRPSKTVDTVNSLLNNQLVPKDLVASLTKEAAGSGQGSAFGQMLDKILTPYKSFVTAFPGTHFRTNLDQMVLQPWLSGVGSFENAANAEKYLAGALPEGAMNETARQAFVHGAAMDKQYLGQIGEQALTRGKGLQQVFPQQSPESSLFNSLSDFFKGYAGKEGESYFSKTTGLNFNADTNPFVQRSLEAHNTQGQAARLTQFQGLLDQGYKPEVAARLTNVGQIDYANQLTDFEKNVMRRIFPWYGFTKGSAIRMADQLQDPGRTSALLDLVTSGAQKNVVPNYVSPGAAIPIPGADEGSQRYISGFGLPQENEAILGLISMLHGDISGGARKILSGVNPLAQIAIEQGTGQQIFTGRPLDELHPSSVASLGGLLPNRLATLAQEILGATPAARVTSTLDKALGGRDVDPVLNALLGIRTTDINNATASKYGAEDALREMLMQTGEAKRQNDVYLPKATRDQASPQAQRLYQLLTQIQHAK